MFRKDFNSHKISICSIVPSEWLNSSPRLRSFYFQSVFVWRECVRFYDTFSAFISNKYSRSANRLPIRSFSFSRCLSLRSILFQRWRQYVTFHLVLFTKEKRCEKNAHVNAGCEIEKTKRQSRQRYVFVNAIVCSIRLASSSFFLPSSIPRKKKKMHNPSSFCSTFTTISK